MARCWVSSSFGSSVLSSPGQWEPPAACALASARLDDGAHRRKDLFRDCHETSQGRLRLGRVLAHMLKHKGPAFVNRGNDGATAILRHGGEDRHAHEVSRVLEIDAV